MKFTFYKQPDSMDCGPACLKMVARHYGKNFPLEMLRVRAQIGKEGVSLLGISEAAESIGFRTRALKLDFKALGTHVLLPAIIHWNQNHFVVLYKATRRKLYVADPGLGLLEYSHAEFMTRWASSNENGVQEGVALLLEPARNFYDNPNEPEQKRGGMAFIKILNYVLPYKKMIFHLLLGLLIASILQLLLPFLTKSIVDVGINTANIHFIYLVLLAQFALFSGKLAVDFVRNWILLHISTRINLSILTDFLIKLMKLPVSFFDSKKTGDILQRMNDHHRIESFLTGSSLNTIFSLFNLVIFSFILVMFNPNLFFVFVVASILYSLWVILFLHKRKVLDYKRFELASKEQSATIQLVQGMQEIKLHGVERPMRWNWERLKARLFRLSMEGLALNQWQQSGAFFINESKNIIITFISAQAVIEGQMTLGTMLAVQYIIGQLNSPIEQLVGLIQNWQVAKISIDRLNEIHAMENEEPEHKNLLHELPVGFTRKYSGGNALIYAEPEIHSLNHALGGYAEVNANGNSAAVLQNASGIIINNLSFVYPGAGNLPVLHNIDLKIPRGKTTAIVGVSGSGKTTLLKLLLKFYEPQKGEIKLDNTSLSNISHRVWRNHCGVVMQDSFIFSDSIARNIAIGEERIDMQRVYRAVELACIKDFIESLPLAYNTKIGAEGVGISMGQKQRILIARAIYRDPEFIFFDEATNSLDANNESEIVRNLYSFLKGKTVIIVAHRLSTVRYADQIVVLNKGMITERGTHLDLVNMRGEYFTLVKNQLELGN